MNLVSFGFDQGLGFSQGLAGCFGAVLALAELGIAPPNVLRRIFAIAPRFEMGNCLLKTSRGHLQIANGQAGLPLGRDAGNVIPLFA